MAFCLVDEVEKDIVDASSDGSTKVEEFAINSVQSGLQEIAFSRVLRIKELEKVEDELLINVSLGRIGVEVRGFDEAEEELVHDLEVRPCKLQDWLVFLGIKGIAGWVHLWGYRSEEIRGKLRRMSLRRYKERI